MDTGGKERPGPAGRVRSGTVPEAGTQPDAEPGNAPVTAQKLFLKGSAARLLQGVLWLQNHTLLILFQRKTKGELSNKLPANKATSQQTNFITTEQKEVSLAGHTKQQVRLPYQNIWFTFGKTKKPSMFLNDFLVYSHDESSQFQNIQQLDVEFLLQLCNTFK